MCRPRARTSLSGTLLLWAAAAPAQVLSLTATPDGETVYFTTPQRQTGSMQLSHGKLFRFSPQGLVLVRQISRVAPPQPSGPVLWSTNYYDISGAVLNSRGELAGALAQRECQPTAFPQCRTGGAFLGSDLEVPGNLWAANGRYAVLGQSRGLAAQDLRLVDVDLGYEVNSWYSSALTSVAVLPNGVTYFTDRDRLIRQPGPREVSTPLPRAGFWADAERNLLYIALSATTDAGAWRIRTLDSVTGEFTDSDTVLREQCRSLITSKNRLHGLCRTNPTGHWQVWRARDATGSDFRPITSEPGGVELFSLASARDVLWYASASGSLKRLNLAASSIDRELFLSPPPWFAGVLSPGSLHRFPLVESHRRPRLFDGLREFPVAGVGPGYFEIVTPWEIQAPTVISLAWSETFAFEPPLEWPVLVMPRTPRWVEADGRVVIAREDWSGLVTNTNPARPGERIHLFATGLGAVNGPVTTGRPAPLDELRPLAAPFSCNLPIVFAGLAPGTLGYYQLTLQVPLPAPAGDFTLQCSDGLLATNVHIE